MKKWGKTICLILFTMAKKLFQFKKDEDSYLLFDTQGKKYLDHDLDEIAEEFLKFAQKEKFDFV